MELLERDGALAALAEAREAAARGEGRVVVVTGEPGIGKTSLVTRFLARPRGRTRACCSAPATTSRSRGRSAPIHDLAGNVSAALEEALAAGAAPHEIHRLLLAELGLPPRPTVLVLEDVHWADEATLDVITVLARRIGSLPVLLVLTCRDGEAPPGHPVHAALGASAPTTRRSSSSSRCRRARSLRSPATAPTTCTPRPGATRSTSPSCSPRARRPSCRRSVANAVRGRASRLDDDARRLVELVSVVPNRVDTSVLDAVMPDWPACGGGARAPAAARGRPALRALPPRARPERDQVERPDRRHGAGCTRRSSRRCSRRTPTPPTSSTTPRRPAPRTSSPTTRSSPRGGRRRSARTARRTPTTGAPSAFVDRLPGAGAGGRARGAGERGVRGRPARGCLRRDRAGDRGVRPRSATARPSAAARGSCRGSTGTPATAMPRGRRRSRRSRSSSRSASRSSSPAPTAASRSSRTSRRTTSRRSTWGERALELATQLGDERTRAHVLVNIGSVRLDVDHRRGRAAPRGARRRRRGRREARGDARARQPRLRADVLGAAGAGGPLRASRRSPTREQNEVYNLASYIAVDARVAAAARRRVGRGRAASTRARAGEERQRRPARRQDRAGRAGRPARRSRMPRSGWPTWRRRPSARASRSASRRSSSWRSSGR